MMAALSSFLHQLHFLRPIWFLTLLPAGGLLLALWRRRFHQAGLEQLCAAELLPHLLLGREQNTSRLPLLLLAGGWLLAITALAGPVWQKQPQPVYRLDSGRVVVLDLSPSMAVSDITPSRLARARYKILDLLQQSREGRTGLVVFSDEPHAVVPLTEDAATIGALLPALEVEIMPAYGNAAGQALDLAASLLERGGVKGGDILLLTDGIEDMGTAMAKASQLRQAGRRLSVLGIGTPEGGPTPEPGGSGFLLDAAGRPRVAKLDAAALGELAAAGGGRYSSLTADGRDLSFLLGGSQPGRRLTAGEATGRQIDRWQEEGAWLVLPVLLLALAGFRRGWLVALLLLLVWQPAPARAMSWQDLWLRPDQQAAGLLAEGKAEEAAERFKDPAWRAVAQHRAGDYQGAAETAQNGSDPVSLYNRGNSLARAGRLQEALAAYEQALELNPEDEDARHNRELIQQLLEQQSKQQKQQQKQQGQQGEQPQGKKQQEAEQAAGRQTNQGQEDGQSSEESGSSPERTGQEQPGQEQTAQGKETGSHAQQQEPRPEEHSGQEDNREKGSGQQGGEELQQPEEGRAAAPGSSDKAGQKTAPEEKQAGLRAERPAVASPAASGQEPPQQRPEKDLVLEQWLRQVPDDPSGLLRRKFLLEHQRRIQQRRKF